MYITLHRWLGWLMMITLTTLLLAACGGSSRDEATAPSITAQPASVQATVGASATFSVTATGTAPLSYQWRRSGADIAGATAATYTTPPLTAGDDGALYSVVVTNAAGSVTSTAAVLTAQAAQPPTIVAQPADASVVAPATATFAVQAQGSAPLAYQWQRDGAAIAGATEASYTTPATAVAGSGARYSVLVSNAGGAATSDEATLTVTATVVAPAVVAGPAGVTVDVGQPAEFSVTASGSVPLTYQWLRNGTPISGATAANYRIPATVDADDGARFSVVVNNAAAAPATSAAATLTVIPAVAAPAITAQPQPASVIAGASAAFSVGATGTAPLAYQWRRDGTPIAGATAASYNTPPTALSDDGALYSVVVSNAAPASVTSTAVRLTVTNAVAAPSIISQPADATVSAGQPASFTVGATGSAPLAYQWRRNGTPIAGATAATYTIAATTLADHDARFDAVVSNAHPTAATSAAARLTVLDVWTGIREDGALGSNRTDIGRAIASDFSDGSVVIAGNSNGSFTPPAVGVTTKLFIAKYSRSGALLWVRDVIEAGANTGDDDHAGIAIDSGGNIYVASQTRGTFAGQTRIGQDDAYLAKYDRNGTLLWVRQFGSTLQDIAAGVAVDAAGNAFVVGWSNGQLPEQSEPNRGQDFYIAKFDTSGNRQWIRQSGSISATSDFAYGVAVDGAGNAYMTGAVGHDYAGSPRRNLRSDAYAMKYDGSGNRLWFSRIAGEHGDTGLGIAVSADGSRIYVGGETNSNFDVAGYPDMNIPCCAHDDAFVARLDANGAIVWIHNLPPGPADSVQTQFRDVAQAVTTDAAGSAVFVAGHTLGTLPGTTTAGARDIFVARYNADGARAWVRQFGGGAPTQTSTLTDGGWGITLDRNGDLFVTGDVTGSFGTPNPDTLRTDWFVMKLRPGDGTAY